MMIGITDDSIMDIIQTKIEDYEKMLDDLMSTSDYSKEMELKYVHYLQCLTDLQRGLFLRDHNVFDILRMNYQKHDTRFIFIDGTDYTVKKDDICSLKDNYVMVHEESEDKTIVPPVLVAVNLGNVKRVETVL